MRLELERSTVRSWRPSDAESLVRHADNPNVALQLRDGFPNPYRLDDAREWIEFAREADPETHFAIEVAGAAAGGIGLLLGEDVERISAEIGYWLGEAYWGRGIMTEAVRAVTAYAIAEHALARVFALPYAPNAASCRVLEKSGYLLEGRLRRSAIKAGKILDKLLYAYVVE